MIENEISFKVNDIKPYIDYCINNNYEFISKNNQVRILYSNGEVLARLTKNEDEEYLLDFKDGEEKENSMKVARESIPIRVHNLDGVLSMFEILSFELIKELHRTRFVYELGDVKFEIDEYTKPEIMNVIGIEGNKEKITKIYEELTNNK